MSRHSITNCLRLSRAVRNAIARAETRYAKDELLSARLLRNLQLANALERELRFTLARALDRAGRSKTWRAA